MTDLHMTGSDLAVPVRLAKLMRLSGDFFDKRLESPPNQLRSSLLDLANLLVGLHDRFDALKRQLLSKSLFHFLLINYNQTFILFLGFWGFGVLGLGFRV